MALSKALLDSPLVLLLTVSIILFLSLCAYRIIRHPLSHIPGPLLPKITSMWLYYHAYIGDEATIIHKLHARYGPLVRVSPHEIDISDADAIGPIYISKSGFPKAPGYANFDIEGHSTIFSTLDAEHRAPRARAVVPMFSTKNIRDSEAALYGCVNRMVKRMREEAKSGKPVNVLNLTRSLALDTVATHLFQEDYNGTAERGARLSASAFVDCFVAVGRFFYLPNVLFKWIEWATENFMHDKNTATSMEIVETFVHKLVENTDSEAQNYPGRLLALGLEISEVKSQCKDLMFAGTDSTGMNLATICRELVLNPDKYVSHLKLYTTPLKEGHRYEILRSEIMSNSTARSGKQDVQSLPYLSAVVREALRISMANPTRLPRVVPQGGWAFKSVHIPAGSIVGCSAYELHYNATAFPNPFEFRPERWLDGNITVDANKYFFAFGAGSRACIARNLATTELYMATERLVESDVLRGAESCRDKVEIYEWFNSCVKGHKIELIWKKYSKE
jgi:cytochrome P450